MMRNRAIGVGAASAALAVIAVVAVWFVFIRSDAPPPVTIEGAVASLSTATPAPASTTPARATTAATATAARTASAPPTAVATASGDPASLAGDWQLSTSGDSFVGYRVVEELANFGANTAVGRTTDVTGTLSYDGSAITAVEIEANVATLSSDDSRRDNALRRQALETGAFPTATFTLTQPIALDQVPVDGETVEVTATGRLTLHGVTRDVAVPIAGRLTDGRLVVVGSLEIAFADYEIQPPRAPLVLSVEDRATMELQLVFERA